MLIGVDEIIICPFPVSSKLQSYVLNAGDLRIVEEDESEPDGKTSKARPNPGKTRIARPCKYEDTERNTPATPHHWNEANLCRGLAVVFDDFLEV